MAGVAGNVPSSQLSGPPSSWSLIFGLCENGEPSLNQLCDEVESRRESRKRWR